MRPDPYQLLDALAANMGVTLGDPARARTASTAIFRIKPLSVTIGAGGVLNFIGLHD